MERLFLHLLVILLAFPHLIIFSNAIPSTRAQKLLQETGDLPVLGDTSKINMEEAISELINGRMGLEISTSDYEGYSANDHHTPKPPGRS